MDEAVDTNAVAKLLPAIAVDQVGQDALEGEAVHGVVGLGGHCCYGEDREKMLNHQF